METKTKSGYYATIDGLRAFAAIGIAMMHILVNGGYENEGKNMHYNTNKTAASCTYSYSLKHRHSNSYHKST